MRGVGCVWSGGAGRDVGAVVMEWVRAVAAYVVLLGSAMALSGCGDDVYEWRQKVSVEVETPGGLRTGSSVQWVKLNVGKGPTDYYGWGVSWKTDGEAVVVDVRPDAPKGEPRYLFALLIGDSTNYFRGSYGSLGPNGLEALVGIDQVRDKFEVGGEPLFGHMARALDALPLGATGEVKGRAMPAFATFADVDDPSSVKVVDAQALDRWFGAGVRLKRITITKTDEPVTEGRIEGVLDWIMRGYVIPPEKQPRYVKDKTPEQRLSRRHFVALADRRHNR